jgi:hypothetical protein
MGGHSYSRFNRGPEFLRIKKRLVLAASVATVSFGLRFQVASADTTATWTSETSGNWTSTTLWSTSPNFPSNGTPAGVDYQALINAMGGTAYTVTLNTNVSVDSLMLDSADATVDQTAGTLSPGSLNIAAGNYELDGGTISGGTVTGSTGTLLNASSGTLDGTPSGGITLAGTLLQNSGATTYLNGLINDPSGFTFDSNSSDPGSYIILLSGNTELSGAGTTTTLALTTPGVLLPVGLGALTAVERLTIDSGHTLLSHTMVDGGLANLMALTNNGTIQADGATHTFGFAFNNSNSVNTGTIEATDGGSLTLDTEFASGTFTNSGTILADGTGSSLMIYGNGFSNTGSGTVKATNGAAVALYNGNFVSGFVTAEPNTTFIIGGGATFDNSGLTPGNSNLLQCPAGGQLLISGTISGGTVNGTGGAFVNVVQSTLDGTPAGGITLIGTLLQEGSPLLSGFPTITYLQGLIKDPAGFTFDSAPTGGNYGIILTGDTELSGSGTTTTLANSSGGNIEFGIISATSFWRLTVDANHSLLSEANVEDTDPVVGQTHLTLTNNGTIQADGAGHNFDVSLVNASYNAGKIEATNGASVTVAIPFHDGTFTNSGTMLANGTGSLLVISGAGFSNTGAGTITAINGATLELQNGTFENGLGTAAPNCTFSLGSGGVLDNTGVSPGGISTLQPPLGGILQFNGGTIRGGTVKNSGRVFINISSGTFDGTPAGGITLLGMLLSENGTTTFLQGLINDPSGYTFDSAPPALSGNSILISGNTELSGSGATTIIANTTGGVTTFGSTAQRGDVFNIPTFTVDSGHTLLSRESAQNSGFIGLINHGTIQADGVGNGFFFDLGTAANANSGDIKATNGANVSLFTGNYETSFSNTGTIEAQSGSILGMSIPGFLFNTGIIEANGTGSQGNFSGDPFYNQVSGTIQAMNGATIQLSGMVTNEGTVTVATGGTISIEPLSIFDSVTEGGSLLIEPGGTFQLDGGSIWGTVDATHGTFAVDGSGTLDGSQAEGITLTGTLFVHADATVYLKSSINVPSGFTITPFPSSTPSVMNIYIYGYAELSGVGGMTTMTSSTPFDIRGASDNDRLAIDYGHTLLVQGPAGNGGGTLCLTNNGTIRADGLATTLDLALGAYQSSNAGTIEATNGALITLGDSSSYDYPFSNSGIIRATNGATLNINTSGFTNTGTIALHNGTLNDATGLDIGTGTLTGSGTINGNVTLDSDPSTLAFNIGGETQGADYDSLTINGNTILAGDLQITLTNDFLPLNTDIFTVLQVDASDTLTGSFLNVSDGGRLETADGTGSFEVLYGSGEFANEIVLEDFQVSPVPEPSSIVFTLTSLSLLVRRKRRI